MIEFVSCSRRSKEKGEEESGRRKGSEERGVRGITHRHSMAHMFRFIQKIDIPGYLEIFFDLPSGLSAGSTHIFVLFTSSVMRWSLPYIAHRYSITHRHSSRPSVSVPERRGKERRQEREVRGER